MVNLRDLNLTMYLFGLVSLEVVNDWVVWRTKGIHEQLGWRFKWRTNEQLVRGWAEGNLRHPKSRLNRCFTYAWGVQISSQEVAFGCLGQTKNPISFWLKYRVANYTGVGVEWYKGTVHLVALVDIYGFHVRCINIPFPWILWVMRWWFVKDFC